jgi:hypothetical protein
MEVAEDEFENQEDSEDEEEEEEEAEAGQAEEAPLESSPSEQEAPADAGAPAPALSGFAANRAAFGGTNVVNAREGGLSYQEVIRRNKAQNKSKRQVQLESQKVRKEFNEANPDPSLATETDIKKLFQSYCKAVDGMDAQRGEFLNPMQFSSILRLVTEEKSNLFKEMQMFKRFDVDNNASVNEEEFVQGWFDLSRAERHGDYLFNIKKLVGEDNILL